MWKRWNEPLSRAILFVLALAGPRIPLAASDAAAIAAAKRTDVHRIEPSLPKQAFEKWLRGATGAHAEIHWEVNDCGEQTGNPSVDKGRDLPMCAEAQVALAGNRRLSVSLAVGVFRGGVGSGPAGLAFAVITERDGSLRWVESLSRLREAIAAR